MTVRHQPNFALRDFLRDTAPDFCWMTTHDLFLMFEQMYEDADEGVFRVRLKQAKDRGWFAVRKNETRGWMISDEQKNRLRGNKGFQYLRIVNSSKQERGNSEG